MSNPTSGWYAVVQETDVVNLSISIEEAFIVLLSWGIVGPNLAEALVNREALPASENPDEEDAAGERSVADPVKTAKAGSANTTVELVNIDQQA